MLRTIFTSISWRQLGLGSLLLRHQVNDKKIRHNDASITLFQLISQYV